MSGQDCLYHWIQRMSLILTDMKIRGSLGGRLG